MADGTVNEGVVALQLDERQGTAVNGVSRAVDGRHAGWSFSCRTRGRLNVTARAVLVPLLAQPGDAGAPLLPSKKTGTALATRGLGYLVAKYAAFARVKNLTPHDLRHRFGYQMAARTPLHRLTQIMGHDFLDTTMFYIEGAACNLQNEAEKIAWD
jgi:hypothetical protein